MANASSLARLSPFRRMGLGARRFIEGVVLRRKLDRFTLVLGGHIFFETMVAAARLDLFTLLAKQGPMTRAALARALGVEDKPMRILLLGCAALGLLRKRGDTYANTWLAGQVLVKDQPRSILPILEWQQLINYRALSLLR